MTVHVLAINKFRGVRAFRNFFKKSVDKCTDEWYYVFVVSNG